MFWFTPALALLLLIPAVRLLRRGGFSGWLVLLFLVPVVNVVFFWWLAFRRGGHPSGPFAARQTRCGNRHARTHTTHTTDTTPSTAPSTTTDKAPSAEVAS